MKHGKAIDESEGFSFVDILEKFARTGWRVTDEYMLPAIFTEPKTLANQRPTERQVKPYLESLLVNVHRTKQAFWSWILALPSTSTQKLADCIFFRKN